MSGSGWWEAFRSLSVSPAALRLGLPATHDAPGQASSADGRTGRVGKPLVGSLGGPNEKKKRKKKWDTREKRTLRVTRPCSMDLPDKDRRHKEKKKLGGVSRASDTPSSLVLGHYESAKGMRETPPIFVVVSSLSLFCRGIPSHRDTAPPQSMLVSQPKTQEGLESTTRRGGRARENAARATQQRERMAQWHAGRRWRVHLALWESVSVEPWRAKRRQ